MVMVSPWGTPSTYSAIGASRSMRPSSASCRITVPMNDLVMLR
mgnify:CR=1 FL=1